MASLMEMEWVEDGDQEIPVYYESLDSTCKAYPLETEMEMEGSEYELPSGCSALFGFKFQVCITHIPYDDETGECNLEETKCAKKEEIVFAARDGLSREAVWAMLEDVGVPVEHYMVLTILDCAERMMEDETMKSKKVLHMLVDLDVPGSGEEEGLVYDFYPLKHQ